MEPCQAVSSSRSCAANAQGARRAHERAMRTTRIERLPFTIRRVHSDADMAKAVQVRHAAYARHVPEFAASLALPEAADYADDTIVLLAESKLDGSALGSIRIRSNVARPLDLEASVVLPGHLQGRRMVEACRLGVGEGREGRLVKVALIKACFMYCQDNGIEWSVATARSAVDRQYQQMTFVDLFPERGPVPLRHVGDIPHRVMAFEIAGFEARWRAAGHPMLDFFFHVYHPDIRIGARVETSAKLRPARLPMAPRKRTRTRDQLAMTLN